MWYSHLIKWTDGEKERDMQDEEAAVATATLKRNFFAKPEELIQSTQYAGLSHSFKSI